MTYRKHTGTALFVVAFIVAVVLCACHSNRPTVTQDETRTHTEHDTVYVHDGERIRETHDTVRVPVPYAEARNYVRDTVSRLDTPLAWSLARVDTTGMLYHVLAMKEGATVPVDEVHDTVYLDRVVYRDRAVNDGAQKERIVKVPPTWKDKLKSFGHGTLTGIVLGAMLTLLVLYVIKRKK